MNSFASFQILVLFGILNILTTRFLKEKKNSASFVKEMLTF